MRISRVWNGLTIAVVSVLILWVAVPLFYMALLSVTPNTQIGDGSLFPTQWAFSNFVTMWQTIHLARNLLNSIFISGITAAAATLLGLGAAYVLARFRFRTRRSILYSLMGMQSIPFVMLLLPLFMVIVAIQGTINIHLIGQYPTIILTYLTFALPFNAWLLLSFMQTIPVELEEAALTEGATRWQVLARVTAPLMLPGMVVAFVFSFLLGWNDVLFASVLTNSTTQTVGVGLQSFLSASITGAQPYLGQLMAASLTSAAPVVILFLAFQRYLVAGLTLGAVKG